MHTTDTPIIHVRDCTRAKPHGEQTTVAPNEQGGRPGSSTGATVTGDEQA